MRSSFWIWRVNDVYEVLVGEDMHVLNRFFYSLMLILQKGASSTDICYAYIFGL